MPELRQPGLILCRLTSPGCRTRRKGRPFALLLSANGMTAQGLGGRSEATGTGNPVLGEVCPSVISTAFHIYTELIHVLSPLNTWNSNVASEAFYIIWNSSKATKTCCRPYGHEL